MVNKILWSWQDLRNNLYRNLYICFPIKYILRSLYQNFLKLISKNDYYKYNKILWNWQDLRNNLYRNLYIYFPIKYILRFLYQKILKLIRKNDYYKYNMFFCLSNIKWVVVNPKHIFLLGLNNFFILLSGSQFE